MCVVCGCARLCSRGFGYRNACTRCSRNCHRCNRVACGGRGVDNSVGCVGGCSLCVVYRCARLCSRGFGYRNACTRCRGDCHRRNRVARGGRGVDYSVGCVGRCLLCVVCRCARLCSRGFGYRNACARCSRNRHRCNRVARGGRCIYDSVGCIGGCLLCVVYRCARLCGRGFGYRDACARCRGNCHRHNRVACGGRGVDYSVSCIGRCSLCVVCGCARLCSRGFGYRNACSASGRLRHRRNRVTCGGRGIDYSVGCIGRCLLCVVCGCACLCNRGFGYRYACSASGRLRHRRNRIAHGGRCIYDSVGCVGRCLLSVVCRCARLCSRGFGYGYARSASGRLRHRRNRVASRCRCIDYSVGCVGRCLLSVVCR